MKCWRQSGMAMVCAALIVLPSPLFAQDFDLSGYQKDDGAIVTLYEQKNSVDPYFATEALLLARAGGLSIEQPGTAWINWAIKQQQPSGLFSRYVLDDNGQWQAVSATDADDAMLALWLQLVYELAPKKGLPCAWAQSVGKTEKQLDALYDPVSGIYHISSSMPVGLLMDNVEISLAFSDIADNLSRLGHPKKAQDYKQKAQALAAHIQSVFGTKNETVFRVSTQEENGDHFYPDRVAQMYPLLNLLDKDKARSSYEAWMHSNGKEWISQRKDDYAWGLVAITALQMHDAYAAACWQNNAEPMRYSAHWNVVEEAALQHVKWQLALHHEDTGIPCVGGYLS